MVWQCNCCVFSDSLLVSSGIMPWSSIGASCEVLISAPTSESTHPSVSFFSPCILTLGLVRSVWFQCERYWNCLLASLHDERIDDINSIWARDLGGRSQTGIYTLTLRGRIPVPTSLQPCCAYFVRPLVVCGASLLTSMTDVHASGTTCLTVNTNAAVFLRQTTRPSYKSAEEASTGSTWTEWNWSAWALGFQFGTLGKRLLGQWLLSATPAVLVVIKCGTWVKGHTLSTRWRVAVKCRWYHCRWASCRRERSRRLASLPYRGSRI